MSMPQPFPKGYPLLPNNKDREIALQASQSLAGLTAKQLPKDLSLFLHSESQDFSVTLPPQTLKLLIKLLTEMAKGNAVSLLPIHAELSTQEAANLLNVSRPYLVNLLEGKKIPFHKVGTHRRILLKDLLKFKEKFQKKSAKTKQQLTKYAQEDNMGY